jgi:hypothetical protein
MNKTKKGKIGLLYWLFTSFLGSVFAVEIQKYYFNKIYGLNITISERILFWFIIMFFVMLISSPLIFIINLLVRKEYNLAKVIMTGLGISCILSYFITSYFTESYYEAFYIVVPYFIIAFILGWKYIIKNDL